MSIRMDDKTCKNKNHIFIRSLNVCVHEPPPRLEQVLLSVGSCREKISLVGISAGRGERRVWSHGRVIPRKSAACYGAIKCSA